MNATQGERPAAPAPCFAVVGRPNKGKSSIVATLARDDSVYIDSRAGSTLEAATYPLVVEDRILYQLVDTPGIQRARAVLAWLQQHGTDAAARPATVKAFLAQFRDDPRYQAECQLLQPVADGAGIIYVVDGAVPFGPDYEAEMEILRWTGRPRLALINPIGADTFVGQWRDALGQYFQTVRVFDAQRAEFAKQLELLELFGHLDPAWREPLGEAVEILRQERAWQHNECAALVADMVAAALHFEVHQQVPDVLAGDTLAAALEARYKSGLERLEQDCRARVEEVFNYREISRHEAGLALDQGGLFKVEDWYFWGLNKARLAGYSAAAGGVAGFTLAALPGGLAAPVGGVIGAAAGAAGALAFANRIARLRVKGVPAGGKLLQFGPSTHANFPFVLVGRALAHHRQLCLRTHAQRAPLAVEHGPLQHLPEADKQAMARIFAAIRRNRHEVQRRRELESLLQRHMAAVDAATVVT